MYNISVYGSCVSRDIFNSRFVPDYKECFNLVCDQQHISLVSLMSGPIKIDTDNLQGDVNPFYKEVFKQDMNKSYLGKLIETKPDWLLLDFYTDAYYGACLLQDGIYITNKIWQYKKLSAYNQLSPAKTFSFKDNTIEFLSKWKTAVDKFIDILRKLSPNTKIIINKAKFLDNLLIDGEVTSLSRLRNDPFNIQDINYVWNLMDEYAVKHHGAKSLYFDRNMYHLISDHPWGKFYVHYNKEYYRDVKDQLLKIVSQ